MTNEQAMVTEFHQRFEIVVHSAPTVPDSKTTELRVRLIEEEFGELRDALGKDDLPAIAKELADLLYVVYGTAAGTFSASRCSQRLAALSIAESWPLAFSPAISALQVRRISRA